MSTRPSSGSRRSSNNNNCNNSNWVRPKPKNGSGDPKGHWSNLHRMRGVPIRFSSMGPTIVR